MFFILLKAAVIAQNISEEGLDIKNKKISDKCISSSHDVSNFNTNRVTAEVYSEILKDRF